MRPFNVTRRSFLQTCIKTAAVTGLPLWFVERELARAGDSVTNSVLSPNDRPGIALIGCGGMGRGDARNARKHGDIVAVCDVDDSHADAAVAEFAKDGQVPMKFNDFRKVMEQKDVNVVLQATPDHWHTLVNMAAARAQKDVYGEKPLTLTIDEGKRIVKAVREARIVHQTGSQQRSSQKFWLACELVRNGRIGKLQEVHVFVPAGIRGGPFRSVQPPTTLNWDFWLGQAPKSDYETERCHGNFRWWWEYSGGPVTDWGAHHNDIARWGIGLDGPSAIEAQVITPGIPGGYETPSEFEATLTYANGVRQIVRTTKDDTPYGEVVKRDGQRNGVKFIGSDGWIWVNRADLAASNDDLLFTPLPENAIQLERSEDHMTNFFNCVRSRKDPICHIEVGHRSAIIGHLIVIALRQGRKFQWDPAREVFVGDTAAIGNAHLARPMRKPYDYTFIA